MRRLEASFGYTALVISLLLPLISRTAHAQACYPDGYGTSLGKIDWSFNPPACNDQSSSSTTTPPAPVVGPQAILKATGGAPIKIPYLRHPAGGDPVLGDGEFTEARTDVSLPGFGMHYEFTRTYRSRVNFRSPLGFGWDHNYNQRIIGVRTGGDTSFDIEPDCDHSVDFQDGGVNRIHFTYAYTFNGIEYYQSKSAVPFTLTSDTSKGSRTWTISDVNGLKRQFRPDGYLASITDTAGNMQLFNWEVDNSAPYDKTHGATMRLSSVFDGIRTITYVYNDEQANYGVLQCITLGSDCTANADLLVSFNITAMDSANGPELLSVRRGLDQTGEQYVYLDQLSNASDLLNLNVSPANCLDSTDLAASCHTLCDSKNVNDPSTCNNGGMQDQTAQYCSDLYCFTMTDSLCDRQDPGCWPVGFCDPATGSCVPCVDGVGGRCDACQPQANGNCYSGGTLAGEYCMPLGFKAADGTYAPCCIHSDVTGPDPLCMKNFLGGMTTCFDACASRYQCQHPNGSQSYGFYSYGVADDLKHNIVEVLDEKGQPVVTNTYDVDPAKVDFDKVIRQQLGPGSGDNTIIFSYHDLQVEAGVKALPTYNGIQWPYPYSTPDPIVVNPFGSGAGSWNPQQLCPGYCSNVDGGCAAQSYLDPVADPAGVYQNPTNAIVIHDLHGRIRVQYLDDDTNIVRETWTDTGETTDYNYDTHGFLHAVRAASGVRTCTEQDEQGRALQTSVLPAPGYAGLTDPMITVYDYDSFGLVHHKTVDPLGTPSTTTFTRDSNTGRVIEVDQDVGNGKPPLTTTYQYDPVQFIFVTKLPDTPSRIQYPNGRVDLFSDFDTSMGGPRTAILDATSSVPEQHYTTYDKRGRVIETGERTASGDRYAEHYYFDGGGRLNVVAHRMDSNSPWINKTINSHNATDVLKIDSVIDPFKTTTYKYAGQFPYEQDVVATVAPAGTTLPASKASCYRYSADGRLEDVVLPEGNVLHYVYDYENYGTGVYGYKDYSNPAAGDWSAGCPTATPPAGDPGEGSWPVQFYYPGGFPGLKIDETGYMRFFVDDGFGRIIQSDMNSTGWHTPIDQTGYDSRGRVIWQATYASGYGISTDPSVPNTPYHKPALSDPGVVNFTEYEYDLLDRKVKEHHWTVETGEDLITTYDYNDAAAGLTVTDRGVTTTMSYDGRGRLVTKTMPDGSQTHIQYGIGFDITTAQVNNGTTLTRTHHYDTRGRLLETDDENNQMLSASSYDDDGNELTTTPPGMGTTIRYFDSFDRLVTSSQDLGNSQLATTSYTYDRDDRVTRYQDAEKHSWVINSFTAFDKPISYTDSLNRTGTYQYIYANGVPAGLIEPNQRQSSFRYNVDVQLTDVFEGACPVAGVDLRDDPCTPLIARRHFDYSANGKHIAGVSSPSTGTDSPLEPTVSRVYDSLDRVAIEAVRGVSEIVHTYSDAGRTRKTELTYLPTNAMATMTHHFDAEDRLASVDVNGTNIATWNYGTGIGGPVTLTYANATTTTFDYDDRLRQTGMDVTLLKQNGKLAPVASLHDALGRDSVVRMRQRKFGNNAVITDVFQVDSDTRMSAENLGLSNIKMLTGEVSNTDVNAYIKKGSSWTTYALDGIGNIKTQTGKSSSLTYGMDALSRLTSVGKSKVSLDARDNILGEAGAAEPQFTFDEFSGELQAETVTQNAGTKKASTSTVTYKYDSMQRRIAEDASDGSEQVLVWDGQQIIARGSASALTLEVPGDDIDDHIASIDELGTGTARFYHQGPDKSVLALSDSKGLIEGYSYSSFGALTVWTPGGAASTKSSVGNRFLFQGQLFDSLSGTYSMRARKYEPQWGRFVSPDPLSLSAGPSLFAFTGGRPLSTRDPLGLDQIQVCDSASMCGTGFGGSTVNAGSGFGGAIGSEGGPSGWGVRPGMNPDGTVGPEYFMAMWVDSVSGRSDSVVPGVNATWTDSGKWVVSAEDAQITEFVLQRALAAAANTSVGRWLDQNAADHPFRAGAYIFGAVFTIGVSAGILGGVVAGRFALTAATAAGGAAAAETARGGEDVAALEEAASTIDPNKLNHIFGKAEHALDGFVNAMGGRSQAYKAISDAANKAYQNGVLIPGNNGVLPGGDGTVINVLGTQIRIIGGRVIDGVVFIGTASRRGL